MIVITTIIFSWSFFMIAWLLALAVRAFVHPGWWGLAWAFVAGLVWLAAHKPPYYERVLRELELEPLDWTPHYDVEAVDVAQVVRRPKSRREWKRFRYPVKKYKRFQNYLSAVSEGAKTDQRTWKAKGYSQTEISAFQSDLLQAGIFRYRNPNNTKDGVEVAGRAGLAAIDYLLSESPTSIV